LLYSTRWLLKSCLHFEGLKHKLEYCCVVVRKRIITHQVCRRLHFCWDARDGRILLCS
jgi:hypothetical protein